MLKEQQWQCREEGWWRPVIHFLPTSPLLTWDQAAVMSHCTTQTHTWVKPPTTLSQSSVKPFKFCLWIIELPFFKVPWCLARQRLNGQKKKRRGEVFKFCTNITSNLTDCLASWGWRWYWMLWQELFCWKKVKRAVEYFIVCPSFTQWCQDFNACLCPMRQHLVATRRESFSHLSASDFQARNKLYTLAEFKIKVCVKRQFWDFFWN